MGHHTIWHVRVKKLAQVHPNHDMPSVATSALTNLDFKGLHLTFEVGVGGILVLVVAMV